MLLYVITRFRIQDYATWKVAFDDTVDVRIRHGAVGHQVFRSQDDENTLIVILEFTSRGGAIGLTKDDASLLSGVRAAGSKEAHTTSNGNWTTSSRQTPPTTRSGPTRKQRNTGRCDDPG